MKRLEWISAAAGILLLFISGFGCIFFFASKENTKNITKEETFVYRAETDSTSLADTSAGIYANGKVQTKKETFYLIYSEDRLCIYRGDDKIFYDYADVAVNLMPVEIREQLNTACTSPESRNFTNFYRPTAVKYCAETIRLIKYDTRF